MSVSKKWLEHIQEICSDLNWEFQIKNINGYLVLLCRTKDEKLINGIIFTISEQADRLIVTVDFRKKITVDDTSKTLEKIIKINFGSLTGCLELDIDEENLRYRDSLAVFGLDSDNKFLKPFIANTLRDALNYLTELEK